MHSFGKFLLLVFVQASISFYADLSRFGLFKVISIINKIKTGI